MDCEQSQSLISALVDGELGELAPADRGGLDAHVHACPACAGALETLRRQDAVLRAVFAPRRAAATAVAARVMAQVRQSARPVRRRRWVLLVASLASAAAGFLGALLLLRPWDVAIPETVYVRIPAEKEAGPAPAQPHVELALTTGKVELWSPEQNDWLPMPTGHKLAEGARVRTPPGVRCELRCPDGSEVRLNSETEMTCNSARNWTIKSGQSLSVVAPAPTPFEVHVPDAKVTALGTKFDLNCRRGETVLTVVEGKTQLEGKGRKTIVHGGQYARVAGGTITDPDRANDLLQTTTWVRELLVLKGRDNAELQRVVNDLLAQLGHAKLRELYEPEIRSLGDHCVIPLARFVESPRSKTRGEEELRQRAMHILADLAQPWSIPDLIKLLDDGDKQVRYEAARALRRLVGPTYELTIEPERWRQPITTCQPLTAQVQKWWFDNRGRYPGVQSAEELKQEIKSKE